MITKVATFRGVSDSGEPLVRLFRPEDGLEKYAANIHPQIQAWLSNYKPDPNLIVVLVNALGAGEYYGQNVNGDYFSWEALSHSCDDSCAAAHPIDSFTNKKIPPYGYRTFLKASPYVHHRNKDPERAFGHVAVSVLNDKMKRVELVVVIDKDKAIRVGAERVIERLEAGEYPDVSMGARVPFDTCLICGHKSRTRNDYCYHIKELGMGHIMPDGRKVGVDNPYPRFFDISFVFIGADRTAKVMAKLAAVGSAEEAAKVYDLSQEVEDGMLKAAEAMDAVTGVAKFVAPGIDDVVRVGLGVKRRKDKKKLAEPRISGVSLSESDRILAGGPKMGPPPSPNRKEYPYVGTIDFQGLKIYVENDAGDVREGTGPNGKKWKTKMVYPYGEILGTKGTDKDRLDVYVGPNSKSHTVYVVHQNFPGNHPSKAGKYDEDKVMLGFNCGAEALAAYLRHYDRKDFFRSMTIMDMDKFKKMIRGEVKGEKVASFEKQAADFKLEDLFNQPAQKRVRIWKEGGKQEVHEGPGVVKTASVVDDGIAAALGNKTAAARKMAEIAKKIDPDGVAGKVTKVLQNYDEDLPSHVLDALGKEPDLKSALSTTSGMGIVLKPREFQRIMLVRIGKKDLADEYDQNGTVFDSVKDKAPLADSLDSSSFSKDIMRMLLPLLEGRSYAAPVVRRRIIRISILKPLEKKGEVIVNSPLLSKIAAAYNWYRDEMPKAAFEIGSLMAKSPELETAVYGVDANDVFSTERTKQAGLGAKGTIIAASTFPLALFASRSLHRDQLRGEDLNAIEKFVARHPYITALGSTALMREIFKTEAGKRLLDELVEKAKDVGKAVLK